MKKLETMDLKGKAYAQVATRIKEFREMFPNGLIDSNPTFQPDGSLTFKARILKDKAVETSGEGSGNSRGFTKDDKGNEIPKAFEKLETIAVGRALAMIGFMASGEVASFEEMEEFLSDKETKRQMRIQEVKEAVDNINDIDVLREFFASNKGLGIEVDQYIMDKSKQLKAK
jgi:hypothetical protein